MTGLGSLLGALAVTFGLLALAVRLLRRLQHGLGGDSGRVPLHVLRRIPVGPKQNVALLRVADRVLVVSVGDGGTTLLTELTGEACDQALEPATTQKPAPFTIPGAGWLPRLRRALPLALLLLLAGPRWLPAQTPATRPAPAAVQQPAGPRVTPPTPPQIDIRLGEGSDGLHLSGTVGLVVFMGVLTILPALFLLMTSFTRILIVLHFLRSALGTQTTPPGQLLVAFAVLLTGVVMNPVLQEANRTALRPYFDGQISQAEAYSRSLHPFREFMLGNTREQDLTLFADLSHVESVETAEDLPTVTIVSAFVTSELRTAFQMGFVIFLPFVVIDLIVASVLMSLGMFMLPPVMISLPFKLLLFVLADGWSLVVQNLVASFR